MINVLNMIKTNVIGDLDEFKFDFEFDSASVLPVNTYMLGRKTYIIAKGSTAKNLSNNTYYEYNNVGGKWVKLLSTPATPIDNTKITANGDYNIVNNDFTGYNKVVADVDTIYTAEDEGKVVSNGTLIAQTAYPTTITQNDTYDTTDYNSITVNVSGGSSFIAQDEFNYSNRQLLQRIEIPNGVKTISENAFGACLSLTFVTIPNSVISIGERAFGACESLETITFKQGSSLETIKKYAFMNCNSLTTIIIPSSVTSIEEYAFIGCRALTSITFEPTTPPVLEGDLGISTSCKIRVPSGSLSAYTSTANYPNPSQYTYEEY